MATFRREQVATDKTGRQARIRDMAVSLIGMFGNAALLVARGQSADRDVGGYCGIVWHDVAEAIGLILISNGQGCASPVTTRELRPSNATGLNVLETTSAKRAMRIRHRLDVRRPECFGSPVI